jgi:hypothetical protein
VGAVIAAISAAVLAGAFALLGALYGSRREHTHWVRDGRRRAYESWLTTYTRLRLDNVLKALSREGDKDAGSRVVSQGYVVRQQEQYGELLAARSAVVIAGPDQVQAIVVRMQTALLDGDSEVIDRAEREFIAFAREVLRTSRS